MQTILITGGACFIGGEFVRQQIASNAARVINLDKLTYAGNLDSLSEAHHSPHYTFYRGDIGDSMLVKTILRRHRPTAVINFAAESHVDRSIDSPSDFVETNVVGTFRLLEEVRHHWNGLDEISQSEFRFLHVSTDEVYGSLGPSGKFTESTPYAPNSPYSASKAASDHFVRAYYHTYGLPVLTTNCSNNYGPYQYPEKLIPLMILNCIEGKPLPVYGDGKQIRDWLFVADHCIAIKTVLDRGRPGEVYNIGGDCERTNLEIVKAVCKTVDELCPSLRHVPCESLIEYVADRPGHDRRYAIDFSKIRDELGWAPRCSFEDNIVTTVKWYLENSLWLEGVRSQTNVTVRRGLKAA